MDSQELEVRQQKKPTLLCNNGNDSILIHELHRFHTALIHRCHDVDTSHPPLTVGRCVQQSGLEVGVESGIQLPVVTEKNPKRFVRINTADLKIGTKRMMQEVSMIRSYLKTVRASDFHQCLVASLPVNCVRQLLRELQEITW